MLEKTLAKLDSLEPDQIRTILALVVLLTPYIINITPNLSHPETNPIGFNIEIIWVFFGFGGLFTAATRFYLFDITLMLLGIPNYIFAYAIYRYCKGEFTRNHVLVATVICLVIYPLFFYPAFGRALYAGLLPILQVVGLIFYLHPGRPNEEWLEEQNGSWLEG